MKELKDIAGERDVRLKGGVCWVFVFICFDRWRSSKNADANDLLEGEYLQSSKRRGNEIWNKNWGLTFDKNKNSLSTATGEQSERMMNEKLHSFTKC